MLPPRPLQRRLTVWAALCLLAAPLLYGVCWLDASLAGDGHLGLGPHPYASADGVRFGLGGLRYLYQGETLSGPHIGYPLVLAMLALNTALLWLARSWGVRAQRMARASAVSLLLTLGLGLPVLMVAQNAQNAVLRLPTAGTSEQGIASATASPLWLRASKCTVWAAVPARGCQQWAQVQSPNPTAWGVLGLALTGAAGLRRKP